MKPLNRELPPTPKNDTDKDTSILEQGYSKISEVDKHDGNLYDALVYQENTRDTNQRLQKIEEAQKSLSQELKLSFQSLVLEIQKLHKTVEDIKTLNVSVQKQIITSTSVTVNQVALLKKQFLDTSDHLKENISKIRSSSALKQIGFESFEPEKYEPKTRHTFSWDIQRVDNLLKSQGQVSSQSYLIGNINYKVLGGVNFMKDGSLSVYLVGESIHPHDDVQMSTRGRFSCTVSVTDRTGTMMDWIVGKISGNFFKAKMWIVGSVHKNDLKNKGYMMQGKHIKLIFTIDLLN
ncbi:uncharacterized protein LOC129928299 [Biomphalaria glabrata]|uniref:Uncharacterized protein LOC129928299 n=1 Tax=Biomphalaria glabrata TaxID=6526 RepID=A0A9W3BF46_BIOGL|nr:uncharacterized protein LOC129928299 [Biomphalaria glabrata]XP_055898061.1 uncharacterized protein LOC129928299 [Biomphalaria glabrata]XP_055898062.1 uncharacterized protein LOC129928299 [Biomphalaria glabrata]XP_055898063.1 uncharacterized protein LOC129928299 [Biomphalaria glabrata]